MEQNAEFIKDPVGEWRLVAPYTHQNEEKAKEICSILKGCRNSNDYINSLDAIETLMKEAGVNYFSLEASSKKFLSVVCQISGITIKPASLQKQIAKKRYL